MNHARDRPQEHRPMVKLTIVAWPARLTPEEVAARARPGKPITRCRSPHYICTALVVTENGYRCDKYRTGLAANNWSHRPIRCDACSGQRGAP
jgi:hypothetical protein